jgi:MacB-like periplasmic core domain
MQVSEDFFGVMGVAPRLGRTFSANVYQWSNHRVMILIHKLWRRSFGGAPSVIDRPIKIHNEVFTVVSVMPPLGAGRQVTQSSSGRLSGAQDDPTKGNCRSAQTTWKPPLS